MPYNMTPINLPTEITGTCTLPLARVQRIIKADPDTGDCSKNAAFAIAIATEMFVQHLVETTQNVATTENTRGRNKRSIQYRHIAQAVAKVDNLEWLTDVVPKTIPFKEYQKQKNSKPESKQIPEETPNGQQKLGWSKQEDDQLMSEDGAPNGTNGTAHSQVSIQVPSLSGNRHAYDAVRNSYDAGSTLDSPMQED